MNYRILFSHLNGSIGCILPHALDAVLAGSLRCIAFACGDDLTVGRFQAETYLALFVGIYLELRALCGLKALGGLVLDISHRSVLCNACSAVFCRIGSGEHFSADADDLAIGRFE